MHHIVSDGWSMGVLTGEVGRLYGAYAQGEPSPMKELAMQYADYAHWQRQWLRGEILERQLSYWKKSLDGAPRMFNLITDRERTRSQNPLWGSRGLKLPELLSKDIRDLSRREGATLFMTLLAAYKALLYYHSGQHDIVVGSPIANRAGSEVESLIGFFVNTLALRTDLSGNPRFRELLNRVREACLGAYAHQDLPFEQLVQELRPERHLNHQPLFQVGFALQNVPTKSLTLPGLSLSPFSAGTDSSPFDLTLFVVDRKKGLTASLRYNTTFFTPAMVKRFCEDYEALLRNAVSQPDTRLNELLETLDRMNRERWDTMATELKEISLRKLKRREALS
jgi:hypothetical protein